ncbi:MAG: oligoendopeptidase F [Clostridiales bacterium]|nr:oligoendopeptidase F [Clostridiales bacterium]
MKRNEVNKADLWRIEDIYTSVSEWEKDFSELNKQLAGILQYKGKLSDKYEFLACMECNSSLMQKLEKLFCYAQLKHDENGADEEGLSLYGRAEDLYMHYSTYSSFITPELSALDDVTLSAFVHDPDLAVYSYMLSEIRRSKKHILSQEEERILALGQVAFSGSYNVFNMINNVDLPMPKIDINGERKRLTHGLYSECLSSKDPELRKRAFDGLYRAVGSLINTLAANYASSVQKDNFLAVARGYKSAVDKSTDSDNVPSGVYEKLIKTVSENLDPVHRYVAFRKEAMGVDKLHMYDLYTSIVPNADLKLSYEEAFALVKKGLAPLGSEYAELLQTAHDCRWMDVYETDNKRSGAYSMGVYGVHPFVLLNYSSTPHDVFTIAHELGHAMHSYYSSKTQDYVNADYSIFVAEVASTVNEVLLLKYMLKNEADPAMKKFLLQYYLDMFRTTLFRQTMFAEFELKSHTMAQTGKPLTVESLSREYLKLNKKYYGAAVTHDRAIRYEWARIPHFYSAFYVYKYATGITSAVNIAKAILTQGEPMVKLYKEKFLSAGGSKSPYDILCDVGVDLCTDAPYKTAMNEFADTLAALEAMR